MKHLTISVLATLTILLAPASALAQESLKARIARIERDFGVSFVYASSLPLESRQAAGTQGSFSASGSQHTPSEGTPGPVSGTQIHRLKPC